MIHVFKFSYIHFKKKNSPGNNAFTLIELLVVISIIALLMAIIIPSLGQAKRFAQKVICKNNLREQCLGIILYSDDNDTSVPNTSGGWWLWDVSFNNTDLLSQYAGFDDDKTFFCPANKDKKPADARIWQYGWLDTNSSPAGSKPFPNEVSLLDESFLSPTQKETYYRIPPIVYMLDKIGPGGVSNLDEYLVTGERAEWIRKLSNVKAAGSKEMVVDAVLSEGNDWKFTDVQYGGIDELSGGNLLDGTNHLSRQTIGIPPNSGPQPDGGNVGYADGHADWRKFEDMAHRYTSTGAGPVWFWW